ncbi:hypothetical protein [Kistimonas asteriae]|uniref:hypothetical protein n=1 Tax=Kistimonas asteriae TaxID=517724 RepID=UPI001BA94D3F|nr:hypothetical protein [Kistimonas asteriae]
MPGDSEKQCLYCRAMSRQSETHCTQCGMPLPDSLHTGQTRRQQYFWLSFTAISLFCLIMVFWLPR